MKKYIKVSSVILFVCSVTNCNKPAIQTNQAYNGIDSQILNIVDSMLINYELANHELVNTIVNYELPPFVTITFGRNNDGGYAVWFLTALGIPPPPFPPAAIKNILISEGDEFSGYKKYGDIYLIFEESGSKGNFDKFVKRDSLNFDEEPFDLFNVYEHDGKIIDKINIKKTYFINPNDSLIFIKEERI